MEMKKTYIRPAVFAHRIQPTTMIAGSEIILLDNLQSETTNVQMPGGEIPPDNALLRDFLW